jgi:hypothetical protein
MSTLFFALPDLKRRFAQTVRQLRAMRGGRRRPQCSPAEHPPMSALEP